MQPVHHFNLAGVDLNLLVVFDALMTEQNVTRAAEKIGLSQPATSSALARLRLLFKDELFVKTSRGVTPTPRAVSLVDPIRQALLQIQSVLSSEEQFKPATSERIFRLGMDDYTELVFLPGLLKCLEQQAPKVKLQILATNWMRSPKLLDADEIDLAVGYCPQWQSWHQRQTLYEEKFVCAARRGHPAMNKQIAIEQYLAASHLLMSPKGDLAGLVDQTLEQHKLKRNVVMAVPNFLAIPFVLASTNLIATLPEQLIKSCDEALNLSISPLPFEMPGFSVDLLWHSKSDRDPGLIWLRTTLVQIYAG